MYDATLGTDWAGLDMDAVIGRAFALGVAEVIGTTPEGELDRLRAEVDDGYDRSLVDLAFREGRAKAARLRPEHDDEVIWEELTEAGPEMNWDELPRDPIRPPRRNDLPGALRSLPLLTGPRRAVDRLKQVDLPSFLR